MLNSIPLDHQQLMYVGHYFYGVLASPYPSLNGSTERVQEVRLPQLLDIGDIDGDANDWLGERVQMELVDVQDVHPSVVLEKDIELVQKAAIILNVMKVFKDQVHGSPPY